MTTTNRLEYDGKTGDLYGIWAMNILLKVVTLGIYSFWGKTRMRRYLASSFALGGDRFQYIGTGMELFLGFLKALPIILLIYSPLIIWNPEQYPVVNLVFFPIIFLIFAGIYFAMRYRLSRLTWRGVRGRLTGSPWAYAALRIGRFILNVVTLGYLVPHSDMKIQRFVMENVHFGSAKAEFNGDHKPLVGINLITILIFIPTLGFSRLWYRAAMMNHVYSCTTIGGLQLRGHFSGGKIFWLLFGNMLWILLTLGIGAPVVIQRNMKFLASTLTLEGDLETSSILQSTEKLGTSGEGLDGFFDGGEIGL
ncbi:MAG: DUF898 domain-containing protein [Alphaproteobacteria bacterium]|nr:DUF898 domain-containing protein [Alphaproteobacteria bacterium]